VDSASSGAQAALARQARLARCMLNPALYDHPVDKVEMLETHISYVFLAGAFAYKMKKAVNLGFLDFTTLDARHLY
jgi:aminoglycoside phosphotransferase family enzyme